MEVMLHACGNPRCGAYRRFTRVSAQDLEGMVEGITCAECGMLEIVGYPTLEMERTTVRQFLLDNPVATDDEISEGLLRLAPVRAIEDQDRGMLIREKSGQLSPADEFIASLRDEIERNHPR